MKVKELLDTINDGLKNGTLTEQSEVTINPTDTLGRIPVDDCELANFYGLKSILLNAMGEKVDEKDCLELILNVRLINNTALTEIDEEE